ncbi:MAG TPA: response regulator transcription factor [Steroidobacteraceae bacterium]|nr:response regulator transcription factor [Steroidobacteraceae bacterium]
MRILLVEDHRDIAANIAEYCEARGDSVQIAADGLTGLKLARSGEHDVIVLDLMLPGMDGLSVCRELRASQSNTPILMLTAKDLLADKVAGFEAGADDYLIKPFSLVELAARLKALSRRAVPSVQRVLNVADLQFDLDTLHATRSGQALKLNPSTRRILSVLMQNTHRVVAREELEQELWGAGAPGADILRAHVHALRNAVDKGFDEKLVHTVHGTGYRIAPQSALNQSP